MICVGGVYLPDNEVHMGEWMKKVGIKVEGKLTYQYTKQEAAFRHIKNWRTAVDVGAHVGTWSTHLVKRFKTVHAFEPIKEHRECFQKNVNFDSKASVVLHPCGLGDKIGTATFATDGNSTGDIHIDHVGEGDTPISTLDTFELRMVDFIKVDVEGYEYFVIKGGEHTIRRDKPFIVVEQKPKGYAERYGNHRMAAVDLLKSWGAKVKFEMSGDFGLAWD
jgi:FkbM family methyltransferase